MQCCDRLRQYVRKHPFFFLLVSSLLIVGILCSSIVIRLALTAKQVPQPQAIFVLGGDRGREEFAASFAQQHPTLDIWVSSGQSRQIAKDIFQAANINRNRIHLDYRAIDTVTNFTSLVKEFGNRHIQHVYLITSDFHMRRAQAIAFFVFGSRGIITTPIPIPSNQPNETLWRVSRDIGRAILWIITGRTGASLHPQLGAAFLSSNL
ncbi:YdcF family protein [Picosynechococcus sp. PCC 11901]|uniref:YdcF family protein n=1 Tax=Picosynechococcus sp. PCC 11901 TaxID=2579791 RepID=UPI0010FC27D1|nr:YdcF family protein [Picosynechococcus sp. PCC 11901]QCS50074.1 YdcF family protein [Picosynechococcus sp. PCC 11901]